MNKISGHKVFNFVYMEAFFLSILYIYMYIYVYKRNSFKSFKTVFVNLVKARDTYMCLQFDLI